MINLVSDGKAVTIKKTFSRKTEVSINIEANECILWELLTNSNDYPRWNTTIISIKGTIFKGEKIVLKSTLEPNREFKLFVKEFKPYKRLVWGNAMGYRIYTLKFIGKKLTNFNMSEKIGGPLFPLFSKMIPTFDRSFEQFAWDLKKASEIIETTKQK